MLKAMDDQIPFILGSAGCHHLGIHPGTIEFDRDKVGVTDIHTEADSGGRVFNLLIGHQ
ncbi:hypothetical protein XBFFL1_1570003 [Xenorhabdus bovienii str. feltiae Florida]|nr:hypothetical protein XBFFL1_1570003 [Xenorhabdus bovienii str. feltiae Florida]